MAVLLDPWSQPGPAAFTARICGVADRQKVALLHAPFAAQAVAEALRNHLTKDGRFSTFMISLDDHRLFTAALAGEAGLGPSSPASLAASRSFEHAAIVVRSRGALDPGLAAFARMICRQPEGAGPILLVVSEDGGCRLEGHKIEPVHKVFGPLDGAAYASALPRSLPPLEARLVASVAIEVAAWDVGLLDRLTALSTDRAVRPDLCIGDWDRGETTFWQGVAPSWESGCIDDWGGEPAEHALWLAANRPTALAKRVWRGQLSMLLPWIEQQRQLVIELEWRNLRPDPVRSGPDIESLDWGPLAYQLQRVPRLKRLTVAFREARNELAHGRPISWAMIKACLDVVRAGGS